MLCKYIAYIGFTFVPLNKWMFNLILFIMENEILDINNLHDLAESTKTSLYDIEQLTEREFKTLQSTLRLLKIIQSNCKNKGLYI